MKTIIFLLSILTSFAASSQTWSWKIHFNKRIIINTTEESETKNIVKIRRSELNKTGQLSIDFRETPPNKDWVRTFAIFNDTDSTLFEKTAMNFVKISNSNLKKMSRGEKRIKIYTWSLPRNPQLASTIRIRRVHLCTIELQ